MSDKSRLYTVSELASELAITPRAIRHYENEKLLSPRRVGNNRVFDYRDMGRLKFILKFKALGFMLKEIKEYLDLYDVDETRVTQLKNGYRRICDRMVGLEDQIKKMQSTLDELMNLKQEVISKLEERGVDADKPVL